MNEINEEIVLKAYKAEKDILQCHNFIFVDKEIDLNNIIKI